MAWSWKIGEFAGIGVYIHATFLILIGWVGLATYFQDQSLSATLVAIAFILSLFACVVLHEFGHALTAKRYGIPTRDITLLPIGGVARLERMPDDPRQELWVALAGPAVNVVIAAAIFAWLHLTGQMPAAPAPEQVNLMEGPFLLRLMAVNVILVLFNMLPAFPMDGGRVLRALLAMRMDYVKATSIAAGLGQAMAFMFGFIGLFTNPFLLFIALFVWMGAGQEAAMAGMKAALSGIPVSRAMVTNFHTLSPDDTLHRAVEEILAGSQHDFPVLEHGRVVGVLTRSDLLKALAGEGPAARVADVMRRDFQSVGPSEMLEAAFLRLQSCDCHTMPVVQGNRLVGLFTMDNIGEFMSIQAALGGKRGVRGSLLQA